MTGSLSRREGYAALLAATGDHPFVRLDLSPSMAATWWQGPGAVAFTRTGHRGRTSWTVLGTDEGAAAVVEDLPGLLRQHTPGAARATAVTVPRQVEQLLHARFRVSLGGDWEWYYTLQPPPAPHLEDTVVLLDHGERRDEVAAFLAVASPTADTAPGGPQRWFAVETPGHRLLAVTAYGLTGAGVPVLSSVAVDPAERGRGLGRRVVAAVTRLAVLEHGACTLGMYSTNAAGRALYRSLGYASPVAWASRVVLPLP